MGSTFKFQEFDILNVIKNGKPLLGSAGKEYDLDLGTLSTEERSKIMKKSLKQRLGFGAEFMDEDILEDFAIDTQPIQSVQRIDQIDISKLSAKERFKLKRKNKGPTPLSKKNKEDDTSDDKLVVEFKPKEVYQDDSVFPFQWLVEQLALDLFDPGWEIRHGAALGLMEILKHVGKDFGKSSLYSDQENEESHQGCLEDLAVRLLSVFGLDKFADFVADQMVAPVRETCGQTLALLLRHLSVEKVKLLHVNIVLLINQPGLALSWQARHAGFLALKYLVAVRTDLKEFLLEDAVSAVVLGLKGQDDDVRAVSAATLLPIVDTIAQSLDLVKQLLDPLFEALLSVDDDLSSAISQVMLMLSGLFGHEQVVELIRMDPKYDILDLIRKFFPFFRHTITMVREAVLKVVKPFIRELEIDLSVDYQENYSFHVLLDVLKLVAKNMLLETNALILQPSADLLCYICEEKIRAIPASNQHGEEVMRLLCIWFNLALSPIGVPLALANFPRPVSLLKDNKLDSPALNQEVDKDLIISCKMTTLKGLVKVLRLVDETNVHWFWTNVVGFYANSLVAFQNQLNCYFVGFAAYGKDKPLADFVEIANGKLGARLHVDYAELVPLLRRMRSECLALVNTLIMDYQVDCSKLAGLKIADKVRGECTDGFSTKDAEFICGDGYGHVIGPIVDRLKDEQKKAVEDRRNTIMETALLLESARCKLQVQERAAMASSIVQFGAVDNAEVTMQALLEGLEIEDNRWFRELSADSVADLLWEARSEGDRTVDTLCRYLMRDEEKLQLGEEEVYSLRLEDKKKRDRNEDVAGLGATIAFSRISYKFGEKIFSLLPGLKERLLGGKTNFRLLTTIVPMLEPGVVEQVEAVLGKLFDYLRSADVLERFRAAKCLSVVSRAMKTATMKRLIDIGMAMLEGEDVLARRGVAEAIYLLVNELGEAILPYVIFLVAPILARMTDNDDAVRLLCTNTFAILINLVPLECGIGDPEDFDLALVERKREQREFLSQLLDSKQIQRFEIPVEVRAQLRHYQTQGVDWLNFLNKYNLHGILCDDMGLGKTLQSICMLASDHHKKKKTSLIVCPPTLTAHWQLEIEKYVTNLTALQYYGNPAERRRLRERFESVDVVICSYEILRNDLDRFINLKFNYCILDEGHVIRNAKTKITKAVKALDATHRLILSGTPVQNNVLELWSLFDFLMPGFLASERKFNRTYCRPISQAKEAKASAGEQELGAKALEALHRQVRPFILRRVKADVLKDLPPKIVQDFMVDLSQAQKLLYEEFGKNEGAMHDHVFQSLTYMRRLCNHPLLVLTPQHPLFQKITDTFGELTGIEHSAKLVALNQLLVDCGFEDEKVVSDHRLLVFSQTKAMLDIIETHLLKPRFPSLSYMRLDGSVEVSKRQPIVYKFNQDPSVDLLLLTTSVGGLGLNLTAADTVIFVDHDWNPMKDLQAMDRAHRLGQTRTVNVYRIITRETVEERIMGLQKFKLHVAGSIVNSENGLENADQVLNLFSAPGAKNLKSGKLSLKQVLKLAEDAEIDTTDDYDTLDSNEFLRLL